MICEICQKSLATVHLTETGKDIPKTGKDIPKRDTHMCEPCAGKQGVGYHGKFSVKDYLGSLAKAREAGVQAEKEPTSMNKIDQAFDVAWAAIGGATKFTSPEALAAHDVAKAMFAAGAQAFSTMPLCEHGVAIWGVEHCADCEDAPGEFPGYNRPFELPEGQAGASIDFLLMADLKAEHESMRLSLLHALVKIGVIDKESINGPWNPITLIHFTGLWLSDALPWVKQGTTHRRLAAAVRSVGQRIGGLETKLANHICDHEEKEKKE